MLFKLVGGGKTPHVIRYQL